MGDLAAVVRGLSDGGATEILVIDGHGNQAMIPDLMVARSKICYRYSPDLIITAGVLIRLIQEL